MEKEISPGWNGIDDKFFQSLYLIGRLKPGLSRPSRPAPTFSSNKSCAATTSAPIPPRKSSTSIQHASIELTSAANGLSQIRYQFSECLSRSSWSSSAGPAHRLRQHRQHAPRPRRLPRPRSRRSHGPRSIPRPHRPSAPHRKLRPRLHRSSPRHRPRLEASRSCLNMATPGPDPEFPSTSLPTCPCSDSPSPSPSSPRCSSASFPPSKPRARTHSRSQGRPRRRHSLHPQPPRQKLIVGQIALSVLLLAAAGSSCAASSTSPALTPASTSTTSSSSPSTPAPPTSVKVTRRDQVRPAPGADRVRVRPSLASNPTASPSSPSTRAAGPTHHLPGHLKT
jgi:hypothetical protein